MNKLEAEIKKNPTENWPPMVIEMKKWGGRCPMCRAVAEKILVYENIDGKLYTKETLQGN